MKILVKALILLTGINAHAAGNHRLVWQNTESVIQNFKDVSKCTERIWPGMSWSGHNILAVNEKHKRQVALEIDGLRVFRVSLDELENGASAKSTYSFFESNEKKWVSVNEHYSRWVTGQSSVFRLGAHEIFHHIGQKDWTSKRYGSRGTSIPIRWEPRYYRAKLEDSLRNAFIKKEEASTHLRMASYWFNRWKQEFPLEVESTTDGYEGTASYAETIGMGLAQYGCSSDEQKLRTYAVETVRNNPYPLLKFLGATSFDSEGYPIGSVAAFLLRWDFPVLGWEERAAKGETPVEILLQSVPPINVEMNETEVSAFMEASSKQQGYVRHQLESTFEILENDFAMLVIPQNWKGGSTSFQGFYVDSEKKTSYSVLGEDLEFKSEGNLLKSVEGTVLVDLNSPSVCKDYGWNIPVPIHGISKSGSDFNITSAKIKGSFKGSIKFGSDGKKWLCAGEL